MMFHSVRDLSQASPRRGRCPWNWVAGGQNLVLPCPPFRDFYTSRPAPGDSARFLRICEFEGSSVRDGRFDASLLSRLAKITCVRSNPKLRLVSLPVAHLYVTTSIRPLMYTINLFNNSWILESKSFSESSITYFTSNTNHNVDKSCIHIL